MMVVVGVGVGRVSSGLWLRLSCFAFCVAIVVFGGCSCCW